MEEQKLANETVDVHRQINKIEDERRQKESREGSSAPAQGDGAPSKRQKLDGEGVSTGEASEQTLDTLKALPGTRSSKWDTPLRAPATEPAKAARRNRWDLTPAAADQAQSEADT